MRFVRCCAQRRSRARHSAKQSKQSSQLRLFAISTWPGCPALHGRSPHLLDAATHGLRRLPGLHLERLPRMADFALWATACETAFWPAGTFARAYQANRRAAIEDLIDADPVAARVREIMANRNTWTGSASDLLGAGAALAGPGLPSGAAAWPKNPRALAGRLRRAQTFLPVLGIDIAFSREGRPGTRVIRIVRRPKIPSAPSAPSATTKPGQVRRNRHWQPITHPAADDADGADAHPFV